MNVTTDLNLCSLDLKSCILLRYAIVQEKLYLSELGEYHTYGVRITTPEFTGTLHDVSVCEKTAERIVNLLNQNQVSPLHLYDVVTDMLP